MNKPSNKDLSLLKALRKDVELLMNRYEGLEEETKDFLRDEFNCETWLHLREFDDNLRDTLDEIKNE